MQALGTSLLQSPGRASVARLHGLAARLVGAGKAERIVEQALEHAQRRVAADRLSHEEWLIRTVIRLCLGELQMRRSLDQVAALFASPAPFGSAQEGAADTASEASIRGFLMACLRRDRGALQRVLHPEAMLCMNGAAFESIAPTMDRLLELRRSWGADCIAWVQSDPGISVACIADASGLLGAIRVSARDGRIVRVYWLTSLDLLAPLQAEFSRIGVLFCAAHSFPV